MSAQQLSNEQIAQTVAALRQECKHNWQLLGAMKGEAAKNGPPQMVALMGCFSCSSYTYHVLDFIGWREDTLADRLIESHEKGESAASAVAAPGAVPIDPLTCTHKDAAGNDAFKYGERFEDIKVCQICGKNELHRRVKKTS